MSKVAITGNASGTGTFTIASPDSNSDRTLTLPDNSGTVLTTGSTFAGTGPAFSAYRASSNQTITANTFTKVQLNAEEFDTASCFDSTTNYRFTPNVAGYYQFSGAVTLSATSITLAVATIFKNGSEFKRGNDLRASLGSSCSPVVPALIYMNGTTDYVELYGYLTATGTTAVEAGLSATYFQGFLARAA
jgi:hypothetical protein